MNRDRENVILARERVEEAMRILRDCVKPSFDNDDIRVGLTTWTNRLTKLIDRFPAEPEKE